MCKIIHRESLQQNNHCARLKILKILLSERSPNFYNDSDLLLRYRCRTLLNIYTRNPQRLLSKDYDGPHCRRKISCGTDSASERVGYLQFQIPIEGRAMVRDVCNSISLRRPGCRFPLRDDFRSSSRSSSVSDSGGRGAREV